MLSATVGEGEGAADVGSAVVGVGTEAVGEPDPSETVGAETPVRVVSPVAAV